MKTFYKVGLIILVLAGLSAGLTGCETIQDLLDAVNAFEESMDPAESETSPAGPTAIVLLDGTFLQC